ncbi:MAG: hypothetical protein RRB22_11935 [Gammaproteobacteria bacterium]|nr:hypothetical protein [Gammaproteobacteria bacterium]
MPAQCLYHNLQGGLRAFARFTEHSSIVVRAIRTNFFQQVLSFHTRAQRLSTPGACITNCTEAHRH